MLHQPILEEGQQIHAHGGGTHAQLLFHLIQLGNKLLMDLHVFRCGLVGGNIEQPFFITKVGGRVIAQFLEHTDHFGGGLVMRHGLMQFVDILHQQLVFPVHQGHVQFELGRPLHKLVGGGLIIVA